MIMKKSKGSEYKRLFQELKLSQTDFYTIECKSNDFKLREELKSYKMENGDKVRIIGGEHNYNSSELLSFLWMFKANEDEKDIRYQIIHARTNLTVTTEDYECYLSESRQPQYFTFVHAGSNTFKIKDRNECFLTLDGIVEASDVSQKNATQEFTAKSYKAESILQLLGTGLLFEGSRKFVIGLNYSFKQDQEEIILQLPNYRMSQRWLLMKVDSQKQEATMRGSVDRSQSSKKFKIYIRSVLTQQFISYNKQKKKLVQSSYPQQWRIDCRKQQNGIFYIQHVKYNQYLCQSSNKRLELSSKPFQWFIPASVIEHALNRDLYRHSV